MYKCQMKQRLRKHGTVPPERHQELHKAAIACIIDDGRPFTEFRCKGMKKFLEPICRSILICLVTRINVAGEDDIRRTKIIINLSLSFFSSQDPDRKTVRRHIALVYHRYRQKMRHGLARAQHIALTTDVLNQKANIVHLFNPHASTSKTNTCCQPGVRMDPRLF